MSAGVSDTTLQSHELAHYLPASWADVQIVRRFRAMNTHIELYATRTDVAPLLAQAEQIFHQVESRFTRFSASSELSRFNARTSPEFNASPEFIQLVTLAMEMNELANVFDPAIANDLIASGYDRSFEQVRDADSSLTLTSASRIPRHTISEVIVGRTMITAPVGLSLDFGGIGKGYAVDRAAAHLRDAENFLVSAGGDMRASGNGPGGDGWVVSVAAAPGDAPVSVIRLRDRALATSSTAVRRWRRSGVDVHHIIDPRTRRQAETGTRSVSVLATTAVEADVLAKTALILGEREGLAFLETQQTPGFVVRDSGTCVQSMDWPGDPAGK